MIESGLVGDAYGNSLFGCGAAAAAFGFTSLRPVLFLDADEAQSAAMLTENTGALDGLIESTKELFKAFAISNLNTHRLKSPPHQDARIGLRVKHG